MRLFRSDERGQAVVLVALALTGLLVVAGLGIDAGLLYVERRREQVSADAAAFAAAVTLTKNWSAPVVTRTALARTSAFDYAARNGYNNDGTTNTVTVNIPPLAGAFVGNADYAEVIVAVDVRTAFIRILGPSFTTRRVQARAVGGITGPSKPYAMIALSKTASPGISVTGDKAKIETKDGGIMVNSSASPYGFIVTGKADVKSKEQGVDVAGTASIDPQAKVDGTVRTGVAPVVDPLAYLVPPGLPLALQAALSVTSGTTTAQPGMYPSMSVSGSGKIKLNPGIYVIKGGGITVSDHGKIDDEGGDGVLIYNACSDFPVTSGTCGAITITGHGQIHLKGTFGLYAGVSLWQACENTQPLTLNAVDEPNDNEKARIHARGSIYLPCAALTVNGDAKVELKDDNDADLAGMIVASTITVGDKADIKLKWKSDSPVGSIVRIPALVE